MTDSHYESPTGGDDGPRTPPLHKRVLMVFVQPGELFRALSATPVWFVTALLGAVVAALSMSLIPAEVFADAVAANMRPEDAAAIRGAVAPWAKWMSVVTGALFMLAMPVVVSGVTYGIFVFIRGDRSTYGQHLSVMAHGGLIWAAGSLAETPLRIAGSNIEERLSLADLLGFLPLPDGFLLALLDNLGLFGIWGAMVAALGLSIVGDRRGWGGTAAVIITLLVIVATATAWLQQAFGG